MNNRLDVLVVGAGPAGLTLACDLVRRGVNCRVISSAPGGFEGSRAKGVQPRTVEVLDDLGVLPCLEAHSALYPKLGLHVGPVTVPKVMIPLYDRTEDVPHPNTLLVAQYDTDACLRRRLADLGGEVEFGTRLDTFTDGPDGVVATVTHADCQTERVPCRYLVGADGGSSTVRKMAGIEFPGTTDEQDRMIIADLTLQGLSHNRWHIWPRNAGRFMALCPLPDGKFQLMLKLRPADPADLSQQAVEALIQDFVGRAKLTVDEIHWASVWRPNIRLAQRYRVGNVLLVGDAAHVHPPTGAQGMNTGIQDSYNLGWKLAQVLAGAPDELLDTYEAERQPVAARVLGLSSELYSSISTRPIAATTRGDEERQLSLSYRGGPLAVGSETTGTGLRAGDRAPDAQYVDAQGLMTTLHETFRGPHFTLLALGAGEVVATLAWPNRGAPVVRVAIPEPLEGLKRIYGVTEPLQILVRPDGYIASIARGAAGCAHGAFLALATPGLTE